MDEQDRIILKNLTGILRSVKETAGRPVRIVAVSKYAEIEWVKALLREGITDIAENQVQQGIQRYELLKSEGFNFTFHYIGPVQTNKIRQILRVFDWVQTVSREKEVDEFDSEWLKHDLSTKRNQLNCCVQVNVGNESQKNGVAPEYKTILNLTERIISSPSLKLRGIMAIPPASTTETELSECYSRMYNIFSQLNIDLESKFSIKLDTLSMGMSNDYLKAIAHGSTCVRIGTAFFTGL